MDPQRYSDETRIPATHHEVAEFMVRRLDGNILPVVQAIPGSGVCFRSGTWQIERQEQVDMDFNTIYSPCKEAQDSLISTANKLCEKRSIPPLALSVGYSWSEVEDSAKRACEIFEQFAIKDKKLPSGFTGRMKTTFRSFCQRAEMGKTLISMIPDESYTSVLCGGLKIIFTALEQSHQYRQEIYVALDNLNNLLKDLPSRLHLNNWDEELHHRMAVFYASVFKLLETICKWFLQRGIVVASKVVLMPTGLTAQLQDGVNRVKSAADSFEQRLAIIFEQDRQDQQKKLDIMLYKMDKLQRDQAVYDAENPPITEADRAKLRLLERLYELLAGSQDAIEWRHALPLPRPSQSQPSIPMASITIDKLLGLCGWEPGAIRKDCDMIRKKILAPGNDVDEDRIAAVQSQPRFQSWLLRETSSLLAINANFELTSSIGISYISAKIVDNALVVAKQFGDTPNQLIPLAFFCGQHRFTRDRYGKASEVALSLVMQLLDGYRDFDSELVDATFHLLEPHDISSICDTLSLLMSRLPATAIVVLIIDGLNFFGQPRGRCDETKQVIRHLVDIVKGEQVATIKMLFTSAIQVKFIEELLGKEELLVLPKQLSYPGSYLSNSWQKELQLRP